MGSSKGVMLSGIALIIGLYTVGIKKADRINAAIAENHMYTSQAEDIARSGLRFAISDLAASSFAPNYKTTGPLSLFNGSLTYIIDGTTPGQAIVTSKGKYSGDGGKTWTTVSIRANVTQTGAYKLSAKKKKSGYKWDLSDVYVTLP